MQNKYVNITVDKNIITNYTRHKMFLRQFNVFTHYENTEATKYLFIMEIQVCSQHTRMVQLRYVYFLVECGIMWSNDDDETSCKIMNISFEKMFICK